MQYKGLKNKGVIKSMDLDISKRIKHLYPQLGKQSKKLADYIIENGSKLSAITVSELANQSDVSIATVSRFPQQLGYSSFSQFKWSMVNDLAATSSVQEVEAEDAPKVVAKKTLESNIETLNGTFNLMQGKDLENARDLLVHAKNIEFFGLGGSNIVALDAYHKFLRVPLNVLHDSEYHMALMQSTRMDKNDCAVVISHTGNDSDTLLLAESLKNNHVPMIVITSFPESPLASYGDVKFFSISEDSKFRSEALLSLTSQLAINDCLYMLTAQYFGKKADKVLANMRKTILKKHPENN